MDGSNDLQEDEGGSEGDVDTRNDLLCLKIQEDVAFMKLEEEEEEKKETMQEQEVEVEKEKEEEDKKEMMKQDIQEEEENEEEEEKEELEIEEKDGEEENVEEKQDQDIKEENEEEEEMEMEIEEKKEEEDEEKKEEEQEQKIEEEKEEDEEEIKIEQEIEEEEKENEEEENKEKQEEEIKEDEEEEGNKEERLEQEMEEGEEEEEKENEENEKEEDKQQQEEIEEKEERETIVTKLSNDTEWSCEERLDVDCVVLAEDEDENDSLEDAEGDGLHHAAGDIEGGASVTEEELVLQCTVSDILGKPSVTGISVSSCHTPTNTSCLDHTESFPHPVSVRLTDVGESWESDVSGEGEGQGAGGLGGGPRQGSEEAATESLNELISEDHLSYYAAPAEGGGCGKALSPKLECHEEGHSAPPAAPLPGGTDGTAGGAVSAGCVKSEEDCAEREDLEDHQQEANSLLRCVEGEGSGDKLPSCQFDVNKEDEDAEAQEEVHLHLNHSTLSAGDDGRLLECWEAPDAPPIVITCEAEEALPSHQGEDVVEAPSAFTHSEESHLLVTRQDSVDARELADSVAPCRPDPASGRVDNTVGAEAGDSSGQDSDGESGTTQPDLTSSPDQPQDGISSEAAKCVEDSHTDIPDDTHCHYGHHILTGTTHAHPKLQERDASTTQPEGHSTNLSDLRKSPSEDECLTSTEDVQAAAGNDKDATTRVTNLALEFNVNLESEFEEEKTVRGESEEENEELIEEEEQEERERREKLTQEESQVGEEEVTQEDGKEEEEEEEEEEEKPSQESEEENEKLTQNRIEEEEEEELAQKWEEEEEKEEVKKDELTNKESEEEERQEEEKEEEKPAESWGQNSVVEACFEPEKSDDAKGEKEGAGGELFILSSDVYLKATEGESDTVEGGEGDNQMEDEKKVNGDEECVEKEDKEEGHEILEEQSESEHKEGNDEIVGVHSEDKENTSEEIQERECSSERQEEPSGSDLSGEAVTGESDKGEEDEHCGDVVVTSEGEEGNEVTSEVCVSDEVTEGVEASISDAEAQVEAVSGDGDGDGDGGDVELSGDSTSSEEAVEEVESEHVTPVKLTGESVVLSNGVTQTYYTIIEEEQSVTTTDGSNSTTEEEEETRDATLGSHADAGHPCDALDQGVTLRSERERAEHLVEAEELADVSQLASTGVVKDEKEEEEEEKKKEEAEKQDIECETVQCEAPEGVAEVRFAANEEQVTGQGSHVTPNTEGEEVGMPAGHSVAAMEQLGTIEAVERVFVDAGKVEGKGEEEEEEGVVVVERRKSDKGVHVPASNRDSGTSYMTVYEEVEMEEEEKKKVKEEKKVDEESDDDTLVGHSSRSSSSESSNSSDGFRKSHRREDSGVFVSSSSCHDHRHRRSQSEVPPDITHQVPPHHPLNLHEDKAAAVHQDVTNAGTGTGTGIGRPKDQDDNLSIQSEVLDNQGEEDGKGGGRRFKRRTSHQFRVGRRYSGQKIIQRFRQAVHLGKKTPETDAGTEVHPTKLQELARKER